MKPRIAMTLPLMAVLCGCSTPQPVLDHANNGVSMTAALQDSLAAFRAAQARIAQGRLDSIRRQQVLIVTYDADSAFDARILAAAGRTEEAQLYQQLRDLTDSRVKDANELTAAIAALDARMARLVNPLPEGADKLKEVQKTMAVLGQELSPRERMKEAAAFARDLKKQVEDNRRKSAAAEAGAAGPAPMQAAPQPATAASAAQ